MGPFTESDPTMDKFDLSLNWLTLAELTADAELSCIDGRHTGCVLGAPGGDTGEFILLLGVLEEESGEKFSAEQIERILEHYMDRHGRFYLHTDRHALEALEETIRGDEDYEKLREALEDAGSIDALVNEPPKDVRAELVDLIVEPRHTGCGHLKTMLGHIDEFGVRKKLVEATIRAFYRLLWWGRVEADLTILEGEHEESAIVSFETDQELSADTQVPAVCSSPQGPYLFVNHEPARRYKRRQDLELLAEMTDLVPSGDPVRKRLLDHAEKLAEKQAAATISHLAPDLPTYSVTFSGREVDTDVIQ